MSAPPSTKPGPSAFPPIHVFPPMARHTHTIIALHGYGSSGLEFAGELIYGITSFGLSLQAHFPGWKWMFPSSQERYSLVFQEESNEWFNVYSLTDPGKREDLQLEGLRASAKFIQNIINNESEMVSSKNIVLLGLNQGSAIGLLTLLASQWKLGAFIGLSGWIPLKASIEVVAKTRTDEQLETLANLFRTTLGLERLPRPDEISSSVRDQELVAAQSVPHSTRSAITLSWEETAAATVRDTPILLGHGGDDKVVNAELGRETCVILEDLGMKVTWKEHIREGHLAFLETEGLDDVVAFLTKEVIGQR